MRLLEKMNADSLQMLVSDYFGYRAAAFGLDPNAIVVEYVLNWGGFVNFSYRIRDPQHAYHLKLPVHGDLWLNNILWGSRDEWYLVDWDDMRIGDPAADLATLLGPTAQDPRPLKMLERADGVLTSAERERLPLLGRATLFDWVIDPLSDWIDAGTAPEHEHAVRAEKERVHKRALACYEELYC